MPLWKWQRSGVRSDAITYGRRGNVENSLCSQNLEAPVNPGRMIGVLILHLQGGFPAQMVVDRLQEKYG